MRLDASSNLLVGTTTNTNSTKLTVSGEISETVAGIQVKVVSQSDIGTGPNEIPLNQYLGTLAYQNADAIAGPVNIGGALSATSALTVSGAAAITGALSSGSSTVTGSANISGGVAAAQQTLQNFGAASSAVFRGGATNLLPRSEELDNAGSWTKSNTTISENSTTAPDGTLSADTLIEDTASSSHICFQSVSYTAGLTYTFSAYAKAVPGVTGRWLALTFSSAAFGTNYATVFDLTTGAVTNTNASGSSITPVGNGWYRITMTQAATVTASSATTLRITNSSTSGLTSYAGDGTSGFYIWGAQLEAASSAGAYLKTVANAVTTAYAAPLESPNGLALPLLASMTPARNSDMTFELASNTSLVVKVRGSDGTVRSATLTLA